jgi:hypothetical protein
MGRPTSGGATLPRSSIVHRWHSMCRSSFLCATGTLWQTKKNRTSPVSWAAGQESSGHHHGNHGQQKNQHGTHHREHHWHVVNDGLGCILFSGRLMRVGGVGHIKLLGDGDVGEIQAVGILGARGDSETTDFKTTGRVGYADDRPTPRGCRPALWARNIRQNTLPANGRQR